MATPVRSGRLVKKDAIDKPDAMATSHTAQEEARHGDNRQPFRPRRLLPTMEDWGVIFAGLGQDQVREPHGQE